MKYIKEYKNINLVPSKEELKTFFADFIDEYNGYLNYTKMGNLILVLFKFNFKGYQTNLNIDSWNLNNVSSNVNSYLDFIKYKQNLLSDFSIAISRFIDSYEYMDLDNRAITFSNFSNEGDLTIRMCINEIYLK